MQINLNSIKRRMISEINNCNKENPLTAKEAKIIFNNDNLSTLLSACYMEKLIDRVSIGRIYGYFKLETGNDLEKALNNAYYSINKIGEQNEINSNTRGSTRSSQGKRLQPTIRQRSNRGNMLGK